MTCCASWTGSRTGTSSRRRTPGARRGFSSGTRRALRATARRRRCARSPPSRCGRRAAARLPRATRPVVDSQNPGPAVSSEARPNSPRVSSPRRSSPKRRRRFPKNGDTKRRRFPSPTRAPRWIARTPGHRARAAALRPAGLRALRLTLASLRGREDPDANTVGNGRRSGNDSLRRAVPGADALGAARGARAGRAPAVLRGGRAPRGDGGGVRPRRGRPARARAIRAFVREPLEAWLGEKEAKNAFFVRRHRRHRRHRRFRPFRRFRRFRRANLGDDVFPSDAPRVGVVRGGHRRAFARRRASFVRAAVPPGVGGG